MISKLNLIANQSFQSSKIIKLLKKMLDSTERCHPPTQPLIVITGSTGTGKTKLAIELAKRFPSEVISADSMQVYKGLDIVSNKVTKKEMDGIVHHMIDVADPFQLLTVTDYQRKTLQIIKRIRQQGKVPILVGGTFYYIESILYDSLVDCAGTTTTDTPHTLTSSRDESLLLDEDLKLFNRNAYDDEESLKVPDFFLQPIIPFNLKHVPSERLHQILSQVDPDSARTLHPNNKRKIIRCLQVFQQSGQKYSQIVAQQKQRQGASYLGGPLRFTDSLLLNIHVDKPILDQRLDRRVDAMIERGLIDELLQFHQVHNRKRMAECGHLDYVHGMFQMIGFKEFHSYLVYDQRQTEEGRRLFERGLEEMKRVTRKYAVKQQKWLNNRFLRQGRQIPSIYSLNGSDPDLWSEQVSRPAAEIVEAFLKGRPVSDEWERTRRLKPKEIVYDVPDTLRCEVCDRLIVGKQTWKIHLLSKKHKWQVKVRQQQQLDRQDKGTGQGHADGQDDRDSKPRKRLKSNSQENE